MPDNDRGGLQASERGGMVTAEGRTVQRAPEVVLPLAGRRRLRAFSSETLRFSFRKVLHAATREHAYASSPATPLDIFLTENRRVPFPGPATHPHRQRLAPPLSRKHCSPPTKLPHIPGPAKLARLLPARAAMRTLCERRDEIKYFLMRAQKNLHADRILSPVGSPKSLRRRSARRSPASL
jgi:hypothetical protein